MATQNASEINSAIGRAVLARRTNAGWSRKRLAEAADVSERYLTQLEKGDANASIGFLVRVAQALDTTLAELVFSPSSVPSNVEAKGDAAELAQRLGELPLAERRAAVSALHAHLDVVLAGRARKPRGIALLGLRGAGKTTIGSLYAERRGVPFISMTREIETRAGMALGDLFNLGGAEGYRTLENEVLGELARANRPIVLETAGGIVGNRDALDLTLKTFTTIWLKASPETHLARVASQGDARPIQGHTRALEHLTALLAAREPDYARAEHAIDTSGQSIEACVATLERIVQGGCQ